MIRNIQPKHAGKYTCAVQTKVDSVSIATDVVVRGGLSFSFAASVRLESASTFLKRPGLTVCVCVCGLDDDTCAPAAEQPTAQAESGT